MAIIIVDDGECISVVKIIVVIIIAIVIIVTILIVKLSLVRCRLIVIIIFIAGDNVAATWWRPAELSFEHGRCWFVVGRAIQRLLGELSAARHWSLAQLRFEKLRRRHF